MWVWEPALGGRSKDIIVSCIDAILPVLLSINIFLLSPKRKLGFRDRKYNPVSNFTASSWEKLTKALIYVKFCQLPLSKQLIFSGEVRPPQYPPPPLPPPPQAWSSPSSIFAFALQPSSGNTGLVFFLPIESCLICNQWQWWTIWEFTNTLSTS